MNITHCRLAFGIARSCRLLINVLCEFSGKYYIEIYRSCLCNTKHFCRSHGEVEGRRYGLVVSGLVGA